MDRMVLPIFLFVLCAVALAVALLIVAAIFGRGRAGSVTRMPYESGMDPIHDTRRRFDIRFHLLAIAFLVFDVELLFLYPWAVNSGERRVESRERVAGGEWRVTSEDSAKPQAAITPANAVAGRLTKESSSQQVSKSLNPQIPKSLPHHLAFFGAMTFVALLTAGFIYDWRKGIFQWR